MDINKEIKDNEGLIGKVLKDIHFRNIKDGDYEDVYSIGRFGLYKGIKTYNGECKKSTYYYKCIKNAVLREFQIKSLKKNKFQDSFVPLELNNGDGSLENLIPDDIDIERDLILEETKKDVRNTLIKLKPIYQQVLCLHFGIGCEPHTFDEMTNIFGTTPQNIYLLYKKAQRDFVRKWKNENKRCQK